MPDLESLILMALINFLLKKAAKIVEQVVLILFNKIKTVVRRDRSLESHKVESTVSDECKRT